MIKRYYLHILISMSLICLSACDRDPSIKLGATSTLEDSGALNLLINEFNKEHTIIVKPVIAGSGQIHRLIERRDIHTAITHDPLGEKTLLEKRFISTRTPLVKNDFVFVGPQQDPAHIKLSLTPDEVYEKILNTGNLYISRNDQSGTHQMESYWIKKSNILPNNNTIIKTGNGMGATLTVAAERDAYTLVDRATWLNFGDKKNLTLLFEDKEYLPNQYSVLTLTKNEKLSAATQAAIDTWETWLTKGKGVDLLKQYRINNQSVFDLKD